MKRQLWNLALAIAFLCPAVGSADEYTFDANISGFDNQNVFTHIFGLPAVQEINSVSIDLSRARQFNGRLDHVSHVAC